MTMIQYSLVDEKQPLHVQAVYPCMRMHILICTLLVHSMWGRKRRCQAHSGIQEDRSVLEMCVGGHCRVGSCGTMDTQGIKE